MARSFYSHIKEAWRSPKEGKLAELQWQRKQEWRDEGAIERIERPTRLDKARELGYKAKQGVVVARVSVRKGGSRKQRHKGRPPLEAAGCQPALAPQVDPAHLGGARLAQVPEPPRAQLLLGR